MNRMTMTDWRGQAAWNVELETGAPAHRFVPAARPIDLFDEQAPGHGLTPAVSTVESLEAVEDIGRYLPLSFDAVAVAEAGHDRPAGLDALHRFFDPALDEFVIGARFGDFHAPGEGFWELLPDDGMSADDVLADVTVTPAADVDGVVDAFIALPHDMTLSPHLTGVMELPGGQGAELTFGGGDDPLWMLTLLPSADGQSSGEGFAFTHPNFDLWI